MPHSILERSVCRHSQQESMMPQHCITSGCETIEIIREEKGITFHIRECFGLYLY